MKSYFQGAPYLWWTTAFLFTASLALLAISYPLGLAESNTPGVPGYVEKTNWSLQFLFWPILASLIDLSWRLYQKAWKNLHSHGVLWKGNEVISDPTAVLDVVTDLEEWRPYLAGASIAVGLLITALDMGCLWTEYGVFGDSAPACEQRDFTFAFRLTAFPGVGQYENGLFVLAAYLLQGGLIAYASMAFLQLTTQSFYFLSFESRSANTNQLEVRLNYQDPLREFGLADVNRAINITYVFIALGMLLPVLSAYWNPEPDFGQWILRTLIPIVLLIPAAIPITERVSRVKEAAKRMRRSSPDPEAEENFDKQRLWPFEGTQIAYIGKAAVTIAAMEYAYLITKNITRLL